MFTLFSITLNDIDDVHLLFHYIKYDIDDVHLIDIMFYVMEKG
jgi:hypothetical protein